MQEALKAAHLDAAFACGRMMMMLTKKKGTKRDLHDIRDRLQKALAEINALIGDAQDGR